MSESPHSTAEITLHGETAGRVYIGFGLAEKEAAKRVSATYAKDDDQFSVAVHGGNGLTSQLIMNFGGASVLDEIDHHRNKRIVTTIVPKAAESRDATVMQEGLGRASATFPLRTLSGPDAEAARERVRAIATIVVPLVREYGR